MIVGGMGFGTIFTLFVVPAVYLVLSGKHEAIAVETEGAAIADAAPVPGN